MQTMLTLCAALALPSAALAVETRIVNNGNLVLEDIPEIPDAICGGRRPAS